MGRPPGGRAGRGAGTGSLTSGPAGSSRAQASGPGELVLDIGAGEGALTHHLVRAGAFVVAVEPHPGRAASLRLRFAGPHANGAGVVVSATVLRLPHRPFRVVANPPYAISATLLRNWELSQGCLLPRRAFRPSPQVDSAVLVIRRR